MKFFLVYNSCGRYDAVLDQELYEILPQPEDLEQPSEVFEPIDGPEPGLSQNITNQRTPTPCDPTSHPSSKAPTPYDFPFDRSNTSSPYIVPSKPFRAFSAEPSDVPPLENPIILNPKYHDEFKHVDEDFLPKTHFKLPISPYYKPEALNQMHKEISYEANVSQESYCNENLAEYSSTSITQESSTVETHSKQISNEEYSNVTSSSLNVESTVEESIKTKTESNIQETIEQSESSNVCSIEKNKELRLNTDLNISNIEKAAESIVDESIERAVSVAREIKEEIEVELKASSEISETKNLIEDSKTSEIVSKTKKDSFVNERNKSDVCVQREKQDAVKSEKIDEVQNVVSTNIQESSIVKEAHTVTENKQSENINVSNTKNIRNVNVYNTVENNNQNTFSEQKAFTIGLQTIPKIRGSLISSQEHYMLLKTFFIHLTDVMVALSRFILTQPAFNEPLTSTNTVQTKTELSESDDKNSQSFQQRKSCQQSEFSNIESNQSINENVARKKSIQDDRAVTQLQEKILQKEEEIIETNVQEAVITDIQKEVVTEKKKTGSEMAQLTEHKSEELASKMAAVISEFASKTDILSEEKTTEIDTSVATTKIENIESSTRTLEESSIEKNQIVAQVLETEDKSKKSEKHSREGKTIYVATVESHVYTNKDTILDEQFSSSSNSRQSFESVIDAKELKELQNIADQNIVVNEIQEAKIDSDQTITSTDFLAKAIEDVIIEKQSKTIVEATSEKSEIKESQQSICVMDTVKTETVQESNFQKEESITEVKKEVVQEEIVQASTIESKQEEIVQVATQEIKETQKVDTTEINTLETISQARQEIQTTQEQIIQQVTTENIELTQLTTQTVETIQGSEHLKAERPRKLSLKSNSSFSSEISTPTPPHVPPTPLTDEYIFRLSCPAPKDPGVPEPPSPPIEEEEDHEDPHIVKKKLIPHIETEIQRIVYPNDDLKGEKDELLDIERTTSLLASAIDETIKSIEEYKEQVGIDSRKSSDTNRRPSDTEIKDSEQKTIEQNWANVVNEMKINNGKNGKDADQLDSETDKGLIETAEKSVKINADSQITSEIAENKSIEHVMESKIETSQTVYSEVKQTEITETMQNELKSNITETVIEQNIETKVLDSITGVDQNTDKDKSDSIVPGYRPVHFNPDEIVPRYNVNGNGGIKSEQFAQPIVFTTDQGEKLGSNRGIIDGLEDTLMKPEVADQIGKPGIAEEKVAEINSGESDMMREAHVMGLSRVITSHMARPEDEMDLAKIKPTIDKLKDSEVIKALNEEIVKAKIEQKSKEDRRWTTFLQRPRRPVPNMKFGYHGWTDAPQDVREPYRVKIVKQPKPKVAPDYTQEVAVLFIEFCNFDTGLLPWEERAKNAPPPPPIELEDPILIPEEQPEFLEAVDPLAESEVPDLEETGIILPEEKIEEPEHLPQETDTIEEVAEEEIQEEIKEEEKEEEMDNKQLAEQLVTNVQSMVDPNASLEQQLAQMRAQLAALAQLPCVIQQTLEMVTKQLSQICVQETTKTTTEIEETIVEEVQESKVEQESETIISQETHEIVTEQNGIVETITENEQVQNNEVQNGVEVQDDVSAEERERMRLEEQAMINEQRRIAKQKKELMDQMELELLSRQVKQHPTPRVGKPKPSFGPITPQERPVVLPGGRKWRKPQDAYNEQIMNETLMSQAEIIKGNAKGINFLKYEKPPVSLEHLKDSDVYKLIHSMEDGSMRGVDMRTPVMAECDYIEKCRAMTPCVSRVEDHVDIP